MNLDEFEGHTPGPWVAKHDLVETEAKYDGKFTHIINSDGWRVWLGESADINDEPRDDIVDTTLVENSRFCGKKLGEADAKLIAAAPLLLAEVKRLLYLEKYAPTFQVFAYNDETDESQYTQHGSVKECEEFITILDDEWVCSIEVIEDYELAKNPQVKTLTEWKEEQ